MTDDTHPTLGEFHKNMIPIFSMRSDSRLLETVDSGSIIV